MYDVIFEETKFNLRVKVFSSENIEAAFSFALSLHRSSNVPHIVSVLNDSDDKSMVEFILSA